MDEIPEIDKKKKKKIVIDCVGRYTSPRIMEYLHMGRPNNYTCCFFCKQFLNCPSTIKNMVRYIVITKMCHMSRIYQIFNGHDINVSDVMNAINNAIQDGGVALIDTETDDVNRMIRSNYADDFYHLK